MSRFHSQTAWNLAWSDEARAAALAARQASAKGNQHDQIAKGHAETSVAAKGMGNTDKADEHTAGAQEHSALAAKAHGEAAEAFKQAGDAKSASTAHASAAASHAEAAKHAEAQGDQYAANDHTSQAAAHSVKAAMIPSSGKGAKPDSTLVTSMKNRAAMHERNAAAHTASGNHVQAETEKAKASVARGQADAETARAAKGSRLHSFIKTGLKIASHIVDPFNHAGTR